jgi:hypothetical protein
MSEITIQELLKGKSTIIKNKEFYPTKTYVEPFLEKMSAFTEDFSVQVKLPDQITTVNGNEDITYNRVLIQAKLPEKFTIDSHDEVIGFLYGIDVRKPVVKIYRGHLNQACTNLCVFNPQWINTQELVPGDPINFSPIKHLMESTSNFATILKKMKSDYLDRNDRTSYLGTWVDHDTKFILDIIEAFESICVLETFNMDNYKEAKKGRPILTRHGTTNLPLIVFEDENLEEVAAIWSEQNPDWEKDITKKLLEIS